MNPAFHIAQHLQLELLVGFHQQLTGRPHILNYGQCCGVAGVGEMLIGLGRTMGPSSEWVNKAKQLGRLITQTADSEEGLRHAEHRTAPHQRALYYGFSQGIAGMGTFLLHCQAADVPTIAPPVHLPDAQPAQPGDFTARL
eukprot:TRINITY_DN57810_c0_g1_i1.p1 TRINITY_DN57810_c0_g1~~TRINITY_DN57810_c0_g1_i1.p1  ORF type:complete len:141 (-),score=9.63 TRINITY_DN57810_c0_g1_i1:102-524(-)